MSSKHSLSAVPSASSLSSSSSSSSSPSPQWFGSEIPYADPCWYQSFYSPYYTNSHQIFRSAVRKFIDSDIAPYASQWDEEKKIPDDLHQRMSAAGILPGCIGSWPTKYLPSNLLPAGNINPNEWNAFHELIMIDETYRVGSGGVNWAIWIGIAVSLPNILHYGNDEQKDYYVQDVLMGKKRIALAITSAQAGSDVSAMDATAVKSACGQYYTLNGQKKWITNGTFADYFIFAARTSGESGHHGISLFIVEREKSGEGFSTRPMDTMGLWSSGTSIVTAEDVKIPAKNLIGKEGDGFGYIMSNFNHERYNIIIGIVRTARNCYEESFKHSMRRKTFGKLLFDHPVIRNKMAQMAMKIEATWSQLENITYQMTKMPYSEQNKYLGGPIALLKAQSSSMFAYVALEAAQVFGGLSYTRGGVGEKVERAVREITGFRVPGGSEEIMLDLGMKQAAKLHKERLKIQAKL